MFDLEREGIKEHKTLCTRVFEPKACIGNMVKHGFCKQNKNIWSAKECVTLYCKVAKFHILSVNHIKRCLNTWIPDNYILPRLVYLTERL